MERETTSAFRCSPPRCGVVFQTGHHVITISVLCLKTKDDRSCVYLSLKEQEIDGGTCLDILPHDAGVVVEGLHVVAVHVEAETGGRAVVPAGEDAGEHRYWFCFVGSGEWTGERVR